MEEMRVFITCLDRGNGGLRRGDWFTLPVSPEYVKERLKLKEGHEYYILDFEFPFSVKGHVTIDDVNKIYRMLQEIDEKVIEDINAILSYWSIDIEELYENRDKIVFHEGIFSIHELFDEADMDDYLVNHLVISDGILLYMK